LRDANQNISINNAFEGYTAVTAAAGTTALTAASTHWQKVTGSTTQTFTLPDATTLPNGASFIIDNDATGNVTVNDSSSTLVDTLVPGGIDFFFVESNSTAAGSWGKYSWLPASVNWGTSTADLGGVTISNATWNGSAVGAAYGGTGATSLTANNVLLGNGTSAVQVVAPSTSGNVLTSNGTTWVSQAPAASGISQAKATALSMILGF
jgi:hypothetical protein